MKALISAWSSEWYLLKATSDRGVTSGNRHFFVVVCSGGRGREEGGAYLELIVCPGHLFHFDNTESFK